MDIELTLSDLRTGDEQVIFEPTVDCVLKLGQIMPDIGDHGLSQSSTAINTYYEKTSKRVEENIVT